MSGENLSPAQGTTLHTPGLDRSHYRLIRHDQSQHFATFIDSEDKDIQLDYIFNEFGFPMEIRRKSPYQSEILIRNTDPKNPLLISYAFIKDPQSENSTLLTVSLKNQLCIDHRINSVSYGCGVYQPPKGELTYVNTGTRFTPESEADEKLREFHSTGKGERIIFNFPEETKDERYFRSINFLASNFILTDQDRETLKVKCFQLPLCYPYEQAQRIAFSDTEFSDRFPVWRNIPIIIPVSIEFSQGYYLLLERMNKMHDELIPTRTDEEESGVDQVIGSIQMKEAYYPQAPSGKYSD